MRDLRRQALESGKTVSKKAQSRLSSRASSAVHSRSNSQNVSRHASDDEDGNLSDSTNWRYAHLCYEPAETDLCSVNSIDEVLSADIPEDTTEAWKQDLGDRIEEIVDRKRSSVQGRETTLAQYAHILMGHYAFEEIQHKTSELFPALLKSVRSESEKEVSLALRGRMGSLNIYIW
jgi:hypothetical protein